ncbi:MAG TPA: hypothetical protein VG309_05140, partial [Rhizomicrobium sp.]|nr:hypothetical protein [Rhizomicrobium sp.]
MQSDLEFCRAALVRFAILLLAENYFMSRFERGRPHFDDLQHLQMRVKNYFKSALPEHGSAPIVRALANTPSAGSSHG